MNRLSRCLATVAFTGLASGLCGCASSSTARPMRQIAPPEVITTVISITSGPVDAYVELAADIRGLNSSDIPEPVRDAAASVRRLPDSYDGHLYQLVGQTPLETELPVAIRYDGKVYDIYRWVNARVTAEGYQSFQSNIGIVGIEGQGLYHVDLALRRCPPAMGAGPRGGTAVASGKRGAGDGR